MLKESKRLCHLYFVFLFSISRRVITDNEKTIDMRIEKKFCSNKMNLKLFSAAILIYSRRLMFTVCYTLYRAVHVKLHI